MPGEAGSAQRGVPDEDRAPRVGRPPVTTLRREQILDAFEATVAEHGLESTTLQRIADQAGVTRSAIGHFIGSRTDLIDAAAARSVERIHAQFEAALESTPAEDHIERYIEFAFAGDGGREGILDLNDELVALAHRSPHAREKLATLYSGFESSVRKMFEDRYPDAAEEQVATVALASVLLLREADRVSNLGLTARPDLIRARVTQAVQQLIGSLAPDG